MANQRRTRRSLTWLVAVVIGLTAIFYPIAAVFVGWDTLLFRTTAVSATITSVEEAGRCEGKDRFEIGVQWQRDGETHTGSYTRCGVRIHEVGDEVDIYVDTHGNLATTVPAWLIHAGWYFTLLCVLVVPWLWYQRQRRKNRPGYGPRAGFPGSGTDPR